MNFLAVSLDTSMDAAPRRPTSSSTVAINSSLGCSYSSLSRIAKLIAIAIPLSPPRVVPLAFIQSPSTYISRPSFLKSMVDSGVFSQTISICP